MTIYLYKKIHNKTGFKYLGKTTQDPVKYKGSGTDWIPHLREHGHDVTTEILKECDTNEELSYWGRYYSEIWNIVENDEWANRIPETGGGCGKGVNSETATKLNLSRVNNGTHPFLKREDGSSIASDRALANGTSRKLNKKAASAGHKKESMADSARVRANRRVADNTHPFLGGEIQRQMNLHRIEGGTHPTQQTKTCDFCSKTVNLMAYGRWHGDKCKAK